jgi:hypothetical protein
MAREPHIQAVGFASLQVQELQNILMSAKAVQDECLGIVVTAVGEQPTVESARNALELTAAVGTRIEEIIGVCESVKAHLDQYATGF